MPQLCFTPGQVMQTVRALWATTIDRMDGETYGYDLTFETFNGFRKMNLGFNYQGSVYQYQEIVLMSLPAEDLGPVEWFLGSPGWDGTLGLTWNPGAPSPGSFAAQLTEFAESFLEVKRAILNNWSFGVAEEPDVNGQLSAVGEIGTMLGTILVVTDQAYYISKEQVASHEHAYPVAGYWPNPYVAPLGELPGSGAAQIDLSPVVEAIRELGTIDTAVSINNGQAIYSVRSREIDSE